MTLAIWDWLFGTAYWPGRNESPARYGFDGMQHYPAGIWQRLWRPFVSSPKPVPESKEELVLKR